MGVKFYPEDKVHSGWALVGRATTVVGASRVGNGNDRGAEGRHSEAQPTQAGIRKNTGDIKDESGPGSTNTTVHDPSDGMDDPEVAEVWCVFYQARNAYRKACNDVIKSHKLVLKISWLEASRPEEWKIIGHAQVLGETDKFISGHIPVVHCARDFGQYSTRHIRDFLGIEVVEGEESGTRILRLIVMNRLLPIHDLDGKQFWNAFWQCFACMCFLTGFLATVDTSSQAITGSG